MITSGNGKIYGLIECNRRVAAGKYNRQTEESLKHRYPHHSWDYIQ